MFRHDYLSVSGNTLSLQPSGNKILSSSVVRNDESPDNAGCSTVCNDNEFDKYVLAAANEIGAPTYCVLAGPDSLYQYMGLSNCLTWSRDVLKLAKQKYLAGQKCPKCFKQ